MLIGWLFLYILRLYLNHKSYRRLLIFNYDFIYLDLDRNRWRFDWYYYILYYCINVWRYRSLLIWRHRRLDIHVFRLCLIGFYRLWSIFLWLIILCYVGGCVGFIWSIVRVIILLSWVEGLMNKNYRMIWMMVSL